MFRMNNTWIGNGHTFSMKEIESLPFLKNQRFRISWFLIPLSSISFLKASCFGTQNHPFSGTNPPLQKRI